MDARIEAIVGKYSGLRSDDLGVVVEAAVQEAGRVLAEISKDTGCQCGSCVKTKTVMAVAILTAVGIKP